MANGLYASAVEGLLGGAIDVVSSEVRVLVVDRSAYAADLANHRFLTSVPNAARLGLSGPLSGKILAGPVFDAADVQITDIATATNRALVLYVNTGSDATSRLVAYCDTGLAGMTSTPVVRLKWSVDGILNISAVFARAITASSLQAHAAFGAASVAVQGTITAPSLLAKAGFGIAQVGQPLATLTQPSLGINIGGVTYFDDQIVFLDLIKQSPDWGLNDGGTLPPLDGNGWPTSLPGGSAGVSFRVPTGGGPYVLLFDGTGTVQFESGTITSTVAGRIAVTLSGGSNSMVVTSTGAGGNYMRNMRLVPVAHESDYATVVFNAKFLERISMFGCLRFLDFLAINGSPLTTWASRPQPNYFSQMQPGGTSIEYAIAACNAIDADFWFNLPHLCTDDYIVGAANLIAAQLKPGLRLYLEYSNEVWNFPHGDQIQQLGVQYGIANGIASQYPDEWDTRLRYQGLRSKQIFDVFRSVLGTSRVVGVLAGQMWDLRITILADHLIDGVPAYQYCDAISVAPYIGGFYPFSGPADGATATGPRPGTHAALFSPYTSAYAAMTAATVPQVVAYVAGDIPIQEGILAAIRDIARARGKPLVCYEGGQHLASDGEQHTDTDLQNKLNDAERHPDMQACYTAYLTMIRQYVQQICIFKLCEGFSIWGRFGHLETIDQNPDPPRWVAMHDWMIANPRWWQTNATGEIIATSLPALAHFGTASIGSPGFVSPASFIAHTGFGNAYVNDGTASLSSNMAPSCTPVASYSGDISYLTRLNDLDYQGGTAFGYNPFDTFQGGVPHASDWFGVYATSAQIWARVEFQSGGDWYTAGGYFTSGITVETSSDGLSWSAAANLVISAIDVPGGTVVAGTYPYDATANGFKNYRLDFTPTAARTYIRVRGNTANTEGFVACNEIFVYALV